MTVEKRGSFYHYQFMEGGKRYYGCFNGKGGKPVARDKKEAREFEFKERLKVRNGPLFEEQARERLKDFATFVDEVYLPFARENHAGSDHAEFRCGVLKEFFAGKRFDEITMMSVVGYINERLKSDTIRKEMLEDGTKASRKRSPTTVNKEVTLLSSIFIMATRERVTHGNPCDELPSPSAPRYPRDGSGTGICRRRRKEGCSGRG